MQFDDGPVETLAEDVGEAKDLAGSNPEKAAELLEAWEKLNGEMMAPVWTPFR